MGQDSHFDGSYPDFDESLGRRIDNATVRLVPPIIDRFPPADAPDDICECALPDAPHTTEAHRIQLEKDGWVALVPNDGVVR